MGWWWGQSAKEENHFNSSSQFEKHHDHKTKVAPNHQDTNGAPDSTAKGRDEQAYEELKSLFSQIDPEITEQASAHAKDFAQQTEADVSDSIYASTMSCSQCFDQAYYCSSIGGQMNNLYRYGALRSCSDLWRQWRFCMRTKAMSEEVKRVKIREYNQQKSVKYKIGRSSEEVWEVRKEPPQHTFSLDPT